MSEPTGAAPLRAAIFLDGEYFLAAGPGAGDFYRDVATTAGLVIGADGGARTLLDLGVTPDLVVGDFDSLEAAYLGRLEDASVELVRHPTRKDQTDGELAVDEALRRGAGEVVLAGGTGALDHTLGHLVILRNLGSRGVAARLVAPSLSVRVFAAPADVVLSAPEGTRVSLVPLGGNAVVTLTGLEYTLDHGVLPADACVGLGNHAGPGVPRIVVHSGAAAVFVECGAEAFGAGG